MNATQRCREITHRLCLEYPDRGPLLHYRSPYELIIAVILSAQTTDASVNEVTPELFRRYPGPAELAAARQADVERIVHSTGFFRNKARNIIGAAEVIRNRFGGQVPRSMEDLTSIPGVGRKSANVIRGVVYGLPAIVVDTHLTRVTNRLGLVAKASAHAIERELRSVIPEEIQTDFSMAVNRHGRACCTARNPACDRCPIRELCPFPETASR